MKIAFLRDPLKHIDPDTETTLLLINECYRRGHQVFFLEFFDLYIRDSRVMGRMHEIVCDPALDLLAYCQRSIECVENEKLVFEDVAELDVLFLRSPPPLQHDVMQLLSSVEDQVFIINSLRSQLLGSSKLYTLNFQDVIPKSHVSRDPARLRKVIDDFGGAMVMKPLRSFGGRGVIKVSSKDPENLNSLIDFYLRSDEPYSRREPIMVQEYLDAVHTEGEVRIIMLNGQYLGSYRRMPHDNEFRANICAGGSALAHHMSLAEEDICSLIGDRLVKDGLYFVGIDVIGGKLIEINCVSPGGLPWINRLNGLRLEIPVIDFIEDQVAERNYLRTSDEPLPSSFSDVQSCSENLAV
jgi:glutathione synthase